jgi:hypothetical protein
MLKEARKPSTDPIQEKLRQSKAVWNKEVSTFVNDLIHLKKLMNGWPNKFHMEKSFIKEPIPADPATIIGSLAGDFSDLAQKGNNLVKQQLEYSKTRKKKQPKQLNLPLGTPSPEPYSHIQDSKKDLSKQLSLPLAASFEEKYELIAEGSSPISRFFARILSPAWGIGEAARIRKYRRSLLDACVKTYKDLGKLQVEIVGSSKNSLSNSNKVLHKTWTDWMEIYRGYTLYKSNMPKEVKDAGGDISMPDKDGEEFAPKPAGNAKSVKSPAPNKDLAMVAKIMTDYKKSVGKFAADRDLFIELSNSFTSFTMAPDVAGKQEAAKNIISLYDNILTSLNEKYETSENTLEEIASLKGSMAAVKSSNTIYLEKVAQDFLRKWIGRTRHELSFFDDKNKSNYRLDIYKEAGELRKIIDQIMNSLEKDMKIDELDPLIIDVNKKITSLRGIMRALNNLEPPAHKSSKMPNTENMSMLDRMNVLEKYM